MNECANGFVNPDVNLDSGDDVVVDLLEEDLILLFFRSFKLLYWCIGVPIFYCFQSMCFSFCCSMLSAGDKIIN